MATSNDEDAALCARAAAGDQAAFGQLVAKHERALRGFLRRMGGGELADDVAQEAFLKAWRFAGRYDGRARYSTWLTSIAWRCLLDARRPSRVEAADDRADAGDASGAEIDDMLRRLSDQERAALILCDGHGWTHGEAAEMLNLPLGTLKTIVARAKAKCRAMWMGESE